MAPHPILGVSKDDGGVALHSGRSWFPESVGVALLGGRGSPTLGAFAAIQGAWLCVEVVAFVGWAWPTFLLGSAVWAWLPHPTL